MSTWNSFIAFDGRIMPYLGVGWIAFHKIFESDEETYYVSSESTGRLNNFLSLERFSQLLKTCLMTIHTRVAMMILATELGAVC